MVDRRRLLIAVASLLTVLVTGAMALVLGALVFGLDHPALLRQPISSQP